MLVLVMMIRRRTRRRRRWGHLVVVSTGRFLPAHLDWFPILVIIAIFHHALLLLLVRWYDLPNGRRRWKRRWYAGDNATASAAAGAIRVR